MIKKQILYESIGYLQLRVLKDTHRKDKYDITFLSTEYPEWRIWHKNVDNLKCKELLFMYKLRSYLLRLLPPKITHWLVSGLSDTLWDYLGKSDTFRKGTEKGRVVVFKSRSDSASQANQ